jgi:hypothetical protein
MRLVEQEQGGRGALDGGADQPRADSEATQEQD